MKKLIMLSAVIAVVASPVCAKDRPLSLGAGAVYKDSVYKGYDDEVQPVPIVSYEGPLFYIQGGGLGYKAQAGYKVIEKRNFMLALALELGADEWDASDSDDFKQFDDRDRAYHLGAEVSYRPGREVVSLGVFGDISDEHDGYFVRAGYRYLLTINPSLVMFPYGNISYLSSDYGNFYWGVTQREADRIDGVEAYGVGSALRVQGGLGSSYSVTERVKVNANAAVGWLEDDVKDSPIVNDNWEAQLMLGASYTF